MVYARKKPFNEWIKGFKSSINQYNFYTDFKKVYDNVYNYKVEINLLNSLVGSQNIRQEFLYLIRRYPECIEAIPLLLAVHAKEVYCQENGKGITYDFSAVNSQTDYAYFMEKTGLFDLLSRHLRGNLWDYVTGIEVGMDSNARKNRGGDQMENLVEDFIRLAGFIKNKTYFKEIYSREVEKLFEVNLAPLSAVSTKRWDFILKTEDNVYLIETNFYSSSGSKLNEIARSYIEISERAEKIKGARFMWITDGRGWKKARKNLQEAYIEIPYLYDIADMKAGLFSSLD